MPGKIMTAADYRKRRAVKMLIQGNTPIPTGEIGEYTMRSASRVELKHTIKVLTDQGHLVEAHCTCEDWAKMHEALTECIEHPRPGFPMGVHPGVDAIDGSAACKHVRAVLMSIGFLDMPVYTLDLRRELAAQPVAV